MFGGEPIAWFDGVFSAFMTGLITNGWLSFPFMMVVILGGLQSIPQEVYEAARIDGAQGDTAVLDTVPVDAAAPDATPSLPLFGLGLFEVCPA